MTMTQNEEPGFERDEDELPEDEDSANPNMLEDDPLPEDDSAGDDETLEEAQEDAAEQRKEGGYQ